MAWIDKQSGFPYVLAIGMVPVMCRNLRWRGGPTAIVRGSDPETGVLVTNSATTDRSLTWRQRLDAQICRLRNFRLRLANKVVESAKELLALRILGIGF